MQKPDPHRDEPNIWDAPAETEADADTTEPVAPEPVAVRATRRNTTRTPAPVTNEFDLEGLMTDFPTATELERFVYDRTGIVLSLKGRANRLKYQVAMDALNGVEIDPKYMGGENPWVEKGDLIPVSYTHLTLPTNREV